MKWSIPAKTFLLGEYASLSEGSALLITTTPCFELDLILNEEMHGIHPDSPAGIWWKQQKHSERGLSWHDPYANQGGLGASSAQFLASYLASCFIKNQSPYLEEMLAAYYHHSWTGKGLRPSGYDVIAQSQHGCVYINRKKKIITTYPWPFPELSFFIVHTGVKLTTHHHLQTAALPQCVDYLSSLVDKARQAFEQADAKKLIPQINDYHQTLTKLNLVAEHSLKLINQLKKYPEVLAIKGCGALGADVILLITHNNTSSSLIKKLSRQNLSILASNKSIYSQTLFPL